LALSQSDSCGMRTRSELTFQVAKLVVMRLCLSA
jgi:hypothetical protein